MTNSNNSNNSLLINELSELIKQNLENHLYTNAVFYSERLLTELDNEETRYLLSQAYFGEGKYFKIPLILDKAVIKNSNSKYLLGKTLLKLNKLKDAEYVMIKDYPTKFIYSKEYETIIPNGSQGFFLLGEIYERNVIN